MDKDLKKLKILMNAINEVEEENQEEEFDEASDFYADLKEAAWNILHYFHMRPHLMKKL
nr:MAG: hypothetical protein [Bacteriophage sp.]